MSEWWSGLDQMNRAFYSAAAFFSVFFVWQLIAALMGLSDDGGDAHVGGHDAGVDDAGVDVGHSYDDFEHGAHVDTDATMAAFKLLSIRSVITFFTLFCWGTALYLDRGDTLARAMGISTIWGLGGMASVALLLYMLPKMAHTGTKQISSCVGTKGSVYLDIPEGGSGEVRVTVSGVVSYMKARTLDGLALKAGTPIEVKRAIDSMTVLVTAIEESKEGEGV